MDSDSAPETGHDIVYDLLEKILDDVFSANESDIAAKGKRLSKGGDIKTVNGDKKQPNISLNPVSLIRKWLNDKDILVELTFRDCHTNLLQLRCVEQKVSGYCGHYAVHNVLCMLEMHSSQSDKEAVQFIKESSSIGAFWRRYWWSLSQLLTRATIEDEWPWTESYVITGDMERSFLRHLLSTDPHIQYLSGEEKIIVLQFAYGVIQNSFHDLVEIQRKIDVFVETPGPTHISFILGVTNHWIVATAYKTGKLCSCCNHTTAPAATLNGSDGSLLECSHGEVHMIVLDSNNNVNITASDAEISARIDKYEKEEKDKHGKGYSEWRRSMYIQSHTDQRNVLHMVAKSVAAVDTPLLNSTPDFYLPFLLSWMNENPPQVLREELDTLLSTSITCLSKGTRFNLTMWAETNSWRLDGLALNGITDVQMFASTVEFVRNKFQSEQTVLSS